MYGTSFSRYFLYLLVNVELKIILIALTIKMYDSKNMIKAITNSIPPKNKRIFNFNNLFEYFMSNKNSNEQRLQGLIQCYSPALPKVL